MPFGCIFDKNAAAAGRKRRYMKYFLKKDVLLLLEELNDREKKILIERYGIKQKPYMCSFLKTLDNPWH